MSPSNRFKRILLANLCLLPLAASPLARAHSAFVPSEITEGTSTEAVLKLNHACEESQRPLIALSYLLPTVNPQLTRSDGGEINNLNEVIQNLGFQNLVKPYFDRGLFRRHSLIKDALGNTIGFQSTKGTLPLGFLGQIPLSIGSIYFQSGSCANRIDIKVAGADICRITKTVRVGDANLWIPGVTPKFRRRNVHGIRSPLTLRVKRDLTNNPLPEACGDGFVVTVSHSDEDIDQNLPIPDFWPKP